MQSALHGEPGPNPGPKGSGERAGTPDFSVFAVEVQVLDFTSDSRTSVSRTTDRDPRRYCGIRYNRGEVAPKKSTKKQKFGGSGSVLGLIRKRD